MFAEDLKRQILKIKKKYFQSVQWIGGDDKKRKSHSKFDDSDDESNVSAPTNDIYRMRQQKKIK